MIGVIDSGVGGLSVALPLRRALAQADIAYLADVGFAPYGEHTQAEIVQRMQQVTQWFHGRGVRLLVIACNTATVNAIDDLRSTYADMTFVGIEPAIKPAAQVCERIMVLGTRSTVVNDRYKALIDRYRAGKYVYSVGAPELVRQVESGSLNDVSNLAQLDPPLDDVDALVIGCTHFTFLIPTIQKHWPQLKIFDGASAVVRRAVDILSSSRRLALSEVEVIEPAKGRSEFFTTGPDRTVGFVSPVVRFQSVELLP